MRTATATPIDCRTCLYCATHEKCDGCLYTKDDLSEYHEKLVEQKGKPFCRATWPNLPSRYLHWEEGNWMERVLRFEIEGRRNIVIGGQGEAEVNTRWTPTHTVRHLHDVAEQCGYLCHNLRHLPEDDRVKISTAEGTFELVWDKAGKLLRINNVNEPDGWSWENVNPWQK